MLLMGFPDRASQDPVISGSPPDSDEESDVRSALPAVDRRSVRDLDRDDPGLRPAVIRTSREEPKGDHPVTTLYWLAGILSVGLLIYLFVALFKPEKLQ